MIHELSFFQFSNDFPAQYLILNNNQHLMDETIHRLFKINASILSSTQHSEFEQLLWFLTFTSALHNSNIRPSVVLFCFLFPQPLFITTADEHRVSESMFGFVDALNPLLEVMSEAPVVVVRNSSKAMFCSRFAVRIARWVAHRWSSRCPPLPTRRSRTGFFCESSDSRFTKRRACRCVCRSDPDHTSSCRRACEAPL